MFQARCTYFNVYVPMPGVVYYYSKIRESTTPALVNESGTKPQIDFNFIKIKVVPYKVLPNCKRKIIYKMNKEIKWFFVFCLIVFCILFFGTIIYSIE